MAKKMGNTLVALCSVALGAIYTTGYFVTKSPNHAVLAQQTEGTDGSTAPAKASTPPSTPTSTSNTSNKSTVAAPQKYRDGTYQGSGSNHIGTVYVAVTIKGGKIANVAITECDTHYPQSLIDPALPQEVVQRQSENVDVVSGATLSTYDFAEGVQQALSQALNPQYHGT